MSLENSAVSAAVLKAAAATVPPSNALQIIVAEGGDFLIQLTPESKPLVEKGINTQPKRTRIVQFRVSRAVLQKHSTFFKDIFRRRPDLVSVPLGIRLYPPALSN